MKTKSFEIYFSDLNEDAQKRLLETIPAYTAPEANWDKENNPIAILVNAFEDEDNEEDNKEE